MFQLKITCDCQDQLCEHTQSKLAEIIQLAYDEGYDSGWTDAFKLLHEGLIARDVPGADKLKAPPPPPRKANRAVYTDSKKDRNQLDN